MCATHLLNKLCDGVVLMDDDSRAQRMVRKSFRQLGVRVRTVENVDQVVASAQKRRSRHYILDINMGRDRDQEGLTALERIKKIDKDIFVGVLSNYPDRYKHYKKTAMRLDADVFQEKTSNWQNDVYSIVHSMLQHDMLLAKRTMEELGHLLGIETQDDLPGTESLMNDANYRAYQERKADPQWLNQHVGNYVAFSEGKLVAVDPDRSSLLAKMQKEFPGRAIFFTKVEEHEAVIDIPAPLSVGDQ